MRCQALLLCHQELDVNPAGVEEENNKLHERTTS